MRNLRNLIALLAVALFTTEATAQSSVPGYGQQLQTTNYGKKLGRGTMSYEVSFDYPELGPRPLIDSIRVCIFRSLDMQTPPAGTDLNAYLSQEGNKFFNKAEKDYAEEMDADPDFYPTESYQQKIKLIANTSRYVSYSFEGHEYATGAAHGLSWKYGFSFERTSGKTLTWNDIFTPTGLKQLIRIVDRQLRAQYYGPMGCEPSYSPSELTLPAAAPVLTQKGILFTYGAYEIGAYAEGLPHCTIPYHLLAALMTQKGKTLTNQK